MSGIEFTEKEGTIYIEGVINERSDFIELWKEKTTPLLLNMKKVRRFNSVGIRNWVAGLIAFPELEIILEECPIEVIDQCNLILEFFGKNQVRIQSFYSIYYCEKDDKKEVVLFKEGQQYTWGTDGVHEKYCVPLALILWN